MKRRWLFRSFFILPILLCIIGWWWSVAHGCRFGCSYVGYYVGLGTEWGSVALIYDSSDQGPPDWTLEMPPLSAAHFIHPRSFLGFSYRTPNPTRRAIVVPYWFLMLVFSGILWFVGRKTRPKPNPATAFPIEMDKIKK